MKEIPVESVLSRVPVELKGKMVECSKGHNKLSLAWYNDNTCEVYCLRCEELVVVAPSPDIEYASRRLCGS
ncbi:hypothetical protein LCGC14_1572850 [marine sediment metagenome]|uniref:Uncharacterized protein n=1 Tax=marine sediment metagenome TaxID=412755 RepID=A0A0F9J5F9_9ZZZZ